MSDVWCLKRIFLGPKRHFSGAQSICLLVPSVIIGTRTDTQKICNIFVIFLNQLCFENLENIKIVKLMDSFI